MLIFGACNVRLMLRKISNFCTALEYHRELCVHTFCGTCKEQVDVREKEDEKYQRMPVQLKGIFFSRNIFLNR